MVDMARMNWERASQRDKGYYYRGEASFLGRSGTGHVPTVKRKPVKCSALTKAGKPCSNDVKQGFDVCGPHLDQRNAKSVLPSRLIPTER